MSDATPAKKPRLWRPRFSLRTLLILVLLAASSYGLRYRWEPWVLERTIDGVAEWIQAVDCSPDKRHLVIAGKGEVANVHDADSGALVASLVGHEGDIATVAYSPDGNQIVTSGFDKSVRLWNAVTGEQLASSRAMPIKSGRPSSRATAGMWFHPRKTALPASGILRTARKY